MNTNPLTNPSENDFQPQEYPDEPEVIEVSKDQLRFDVDTPNIRIEEMFSGLKMNLKKQEDLLEISQLWRSPAPALAITTLAAILIILIIGGILKYNEIGPTIPFFYDSINKQFIAVDKIFIFFSGILTGFIELLVFRFINLIAKSDRRLSIAIAWILFFLNILMLAGIGQIYTIIFK